jgi:hypothetical protein
MTEIRRPLHGCLQANSDKSARRHWAAGLLDDLQEGAVIP